MWKYEIQKKIKMIAFDRFSVKTNQYKIHKITLKFYLFSKFIFYIVYMNDKRFKFYIFYSKRMLNSLQIF